MLLAHAVTDTYSRSSSRNGQVEAKLDCGVPFEAMLGTLLAANQEKMLLFKREVEVGIFG